MIKGHFNPMIWGHPRPFLTVAPYVYLYLLDSAQPVAPTAAAATTAHTNEDVHSSRYGRRVRGACGTRRAKAGWASGV
jgi:hypothetical protein